MENNSWRPTGPSNEAATEAGDWRTQLNPDSRPKIVSRIMDTLKRHIPVSGPEGLQDLRKIAVRFEEKIFIAATSQADYLKKITLKMLSMENKTQNMANSLPSNPAANSSNPDSNSMQSQGRNDGQALPILVPANQPQPQQRILPQNVQNTMASSGSHISAGLTSAALPVSGFTQTRISNLSCQNSNIQTMSGLPQSTAGVLMSQGLPSNVLSNPPGQVQRKQQVVSHQQQQQPQNPQQYLYQQLLKQKFDQGNTAHPLMQSHFQRQQRQQQQTNMLPQTQLQSSHQSSSAVQPSMMQSTQLSGLQQNQQSSLQQSNESMIQKHQQAVQRRQQQQQPQQAAVIHQLQTSMSQQPTLSPRQQQPLMGQQSSAGSTTQSQFSGQHNQLTRHQNSVGDMQPQQQRLLGQQNGLSNMQQHQLMDQQNISNRHQQQLTSQSNVSGLSHQQQQLHGSHSGNSGGMQSGQHSVKLLQQPKVHAQQQTKSATYTLPTQGQQSQQQQVMSHIHSQSSQLQQHMSIKQQPNALQQNMQQRVQPGSLLQQQPTIDPQKQLYQSQRAVPETSFTSVDSTAQTGQANGDDWQEELYQKFKTMKERYLPDLNEMSHRIAARLQQQDSLPQQSKMEQVEKLEVFKRTLDRWIALLQIPKHKITFNFKEKIESYEKHIVSMINANKPRMLTGPQMMRQSQNCQSQTMQVQSHENQMNSELQAMNLRGPVTATQPNSLASLQQNSIASLQQNSMSTMSTTQQNMTNSMQPNSSLNSGQVRSGNSMEQVAMESRQQNSANSQLENNNLSSQNGVNLLQPNLNSLQSNPNMLQPEHLKQRQEQQMLQTQQFKHIQQRHMQHQQPKQQLSAQLQTQKMSQIHQMSEMSNMGMRQGLNAKAGVCQPHSTGQQATAFQQLKPGSSLSLSSPQLQNASLQIPQHSSPRSDQQNPITSTTKAASPLQSATSPFVAPSPSTSAAQSPMAGESEKPVSAVPSQSNLKNIGLQQPPATGAPSHSPAIGTPGMSASPLLEEFSGPDATPHKASRNVTGRSIVIERPIDRLIKAVNSISEKALGASVSDIGSVVSMIDRMAGSAPGNGSRAAIGEDLVGMTNCRLQARNHMTTDGTATKRMRRHTSAIPLDVSSSVGSVDNSFKQSATSELESTATSSAKRTRSEVNHSLLKEIRDINQRLIDTVIDVSDEDVDSTATGAAVEGGEGTIVKCSFSAVALSPSLKSQYASALMSQIQPLRLFVPSNYPNCSPVLLEKIPAEVSKEYEDISVKAKSRFGISLRSLSEPMTLGEIARTWDHCAHAVISEYAEQRGGGSFSSKYGTWENCMSAA